MGIAINGRLCQRFTDVLDDPCFVVFLFDPRGQFDGSHGFAHAFSVVICESLFIHHLAGVDLAQMQMWVNEGLRNQIPLCINQYPRISSQIFFERYNLPSSNTNIDQRIWLAAPSGMLDQDIKLINHSFIASYPEKYLPWKARLQWVQGA